MNSGNILALPHSYQTGFHLGRDLDSARNCVRQFIRTWINDFVLRLWKENFFLLGHIYSNICTFLHEIRLDEALKPT